MKWSQLRPTSCSKMESVTVPRTKTFSGFVVDEEVEIYFGKPTDYFFVEKALNMKVVPELDVEWLEWDETVHKEKHGIVRRELELRVASLKPADITRRAAEREKVSFDGRVWVIVEATLDSAWHEHAICTLRLLEIAQ